MPAIEDFLSGVETGDFDDSTLLSGSPTIETVDPINGVYSITCAGTNTGTARQWPFVTIKSVPLNDSGQGRARCRFRINSSLPDDDTPFCGFGSTSSGTIARGEIKSTGEFRINSGAGGVSSYSTAQLAVDTVYIAEIRITITVGPSGPPDDIMSSQLSVYTDAGVLVETALDTGVTAFLDYSIKNFFVGWAGAGSKTANFTFDDIQVRANINDGVTLTSTRTHAIHAASVTGAGANTDWTGTFADIDELPFSPTEGNVQTAAGSGDEEDYVHNTAAQLLLSAIQAVKVSVLGISSVGGQTHAVMIGAVEFTGAWTGTYTPTLVATDLSTLSDAAFDALEFGVKNKTGTATLTVEAVLMQVLALKTFPVGRSEIIY